MWVYICSLSLLLGKGSIDDTRFYILKKNLAPANGCHWWQVFLGFRNVDCVAWTSVFFIPELVYASRGDSKNANLVEDAIMSNAAHCGWEIQQQYLTKLCRLVQTCFKMLTCSVKGLFAYLSVSGCAKSTFAKQDSVWGDEMEWLLYCISKGKMTRRSLHHLKIALFPGWKLVPWTLN